MPSLKQTSAAGGIFSPQLLGRSDQARYVSGFRVLRNAMVTRFGTIENRVGTEYTATAADPANKNRTVKFVINTTTEYLLEFRDSLIIPYRDNARISTVGAPAYAGGTAYVVGNVVTYLGATYVCKLASTGNLPSNATYWILLVGDLLEIPSGMVQAVLFDFQYVQRNDVMFIAEIALHPKKLTRFSDTQWTMADYVPDVDLSLPRGTLTVYAGVSADAASKFQVSPCELTATGGNTALVASSYLVEGHNGGGFNSWSYPAVAQGGVDGTHSVVLQWDAFPNATNGFIIYRRVDTAGGVAPHYAKIGTAAAGDTTFTDTNLGVSTSLTGISGDQLLRAYVVTAVDDLTGAEGLPSLVASCLCKTPTAANPNLVIWDPVVGKSKYRVYRSQNGVFGFIGEITIGGEASYVSFTTATVGGSVFADVGIIPDTTIQPPVAIPMFATTNDYPRAVGVYQQRVLFGGSINTPNTGYASRVGVLDNFNVSSPVQDDDAFSFTIASERSDAIQHFRDLGKLIIHTEGAEYIANGNVAGTFTPLSPGIVQQGSSGASYVPPISIGNSDLFVQVRGGYLRDLRYEIQSTSYAGKDFTIFAPELFDGRTIVSMDWQQVPHSIIWAALDDGTLLGLTYIREQDVWSWHEHLFTNGFVENVCAIPEGTSDVVYLTVRRTINGATTRHIDRLVARDFTSVEEVFFVDSGQQYDGRNAGSTTMTATSVSGGWTPTDVILLTASVATFVNPTDVGNAIVLQHLADGTTFDSYGKRIPAGTVLDEVTLGIITYLSTTTVHAVPQGTLAAWAQVALTSWGKAVRAFSGIDHLEGESISVLADGNVVASPLAVNPDGTAKYPAITVTAGAFTLSVPALIVTAGLPIQMDIQTMPVENAQGETISNKQITVRECCPIFYKSRGGLYGQDPFHLHEWKQPRAQPPAIPVQGDPVQLWTGPAIIPIQGTPQPSGQVWIRNVDPLPFAMSAITVTAEVGR